MRLLFVLSLPLLLVAADDGGKQARIRGIRDYQKLGQSAVPKIEPYLQDADDEVRWEAVKAISELGGTRALDGLVAATKDNQGAIQIRATDGLVNFYLPGYMKGEGLGATFRKAATSIKGRFTDTNTDIIDAYVGVRPDVIEALGRLVKNGVSFESRANAARGLGILRGKAALPDLYEGLYSKNDLILYESLIAIQKIREIESGPKVQFLLRDLKDKVQIAAIETSGILQNRAAMRDLREVMERNRSAKVKRAALTAIAMMPDEANRSLYKTHFEGSDDGLRAAAAEGYARLRQPTDLPALEKAFEAESKMGVRLSMAFACVMIGKRELSEFSPLQYLVNTLNSKSYRDSAEPFLAEVTRDPQTRDALYPAIGKPNATKEEKIRLARVFGANGDKTTLPVVEALKGDTDPEVAQEAIRAARNISARVP
ncbi:MAG: HEAT repeat domain-containing protein [Acidobacteria bacterium]|nr:HEAT repeat domain-containing protein [Acidobacteriota bacterium]